MIGNEMELGIFKEAITWGTLPMEIKHYQKQGIEVFSFEGDLGYAEAQTIKEMILPYVENPAVSKILIDLEKVLFIDSSVFGLMVACSELMESKGGQFALCDLADILMEEVEFIDMDAFLSIYSNEEDAISRMLI